MSARPARVRLPPDVGVRRSGVHGRGLFARDFIPEGWRVLEYIGERITKAEARRREHRRRARRARGGAGCVYIFELDARHDLDGAVPGNPAKWINHSCAPNCETQKGGGRVWVVARRDIAPDEELTFDYGFAWAEWREHPCRCGAAGCPGYIVNAGQRWRVRRILAATARP